MELAIASPTGEHSLCVKLDWPHVVALGVAAYLRGSLLQDSVRGTLLVEAAETKRTKVTCLYVKRVEGAVVASSNMDLLQVGWNLVKQRAQELRAALRESERQGVCLPGAIS